MKKDIAIVGGGYSGEYEISIQSAEVVRESIDKERYNVYLIIISDTDWLYRYENGETYPLDKEEFTLDLPTGKVHFDAIFNAIHGTPGEDGRLQVLFDKLGIPYTSCDFVTSAITFNKYFCNCFVSTHGILTANSLLVRHDDDIDPAAIVDTVGLPCFIKPNKGGSSVGVSKIDNTGEIIEAVRKALEEDDEVIIEEFIPGREITCGVLVVDGEIIALPVTEIVSQNEFFDFEAKYQGKSEEITPALIPEDIEHQCKDLSIKLYKELGCKGVVRCDYIFNEKGIYFLEVNTIPGLTEESIIPQQAREAGISLKELFTGLIEQLLN